MFRTILKSKIHRATVTEANLHYEGSITIDAALMKAADLLEGEQVEVLNLNTGNRLQTYVIKGKAGSGVICLNGPAARSAVAGDQVIIVAYLLVDDAQAGTVKPRIVKVDGKNRVKD